jgi:hypothetical protein
MACATLPLSAMDESIFATEALPMTSQNLTLSDYLFLLAVK